MVSGIQTPSHNYLPVASGACRAFSCQHLSLIGWTVPHFPPLQLRRCQGKVTAKVQRALSRLLCARPLPRPSALWLGHDVG